MCRTYSSTSEFVASQSTKGKRANIHCRPHVGIALMNRTGSTSVKQSEKASGPPSCLQLPIFMIGRDSKGNWVARERSGARGGLFVDRAAALKYVRFESGNRAHAVVWVSGMLELIVSSASSTASAEGRVHQVGRKRRIA
jgi:hypothetical protein